MRRRHYTLGRRVALIDERIRAGGGWTLAQLARELGVTERTVCRDLVHMRQELGLPIIHRPGLGYSYSAPFPEWRPEAKTAPPTVEAPSQPMNAARLRTNLEAIHGALYAKRRLLLREQARGDLVPVQPYPLHPFFLARRAGDLLLFGFRPDAGALINRSIRCFQEVVILPDTFDESPVTGSEVRWAPYWLPAGSSHLVCLRFAPGAEWAEDLQLADGQVLQRRKNQVQIDFQTDDLEAVRRLVSFLGRAVKVEAPLRLRAMLKSPVRLNTPAS
jgi:biotin operon repressor